MKIELVWQDIGTSNKEHKTVTIFLTCTSKNRKVDNVKIKCDIK